MKPSSLHALVIDRHCGELSPEAIELLELHLSQHPSAQAEAERILAALVLTRETVLRHPELSQVSYPAVAELSRPAGSRSKMLTLTWLARAAVLLLLAAIAIATGFFAGRSTAPSSIRAMATASHGVTVAQATAPRNSPWAQYRMSIDPSGEGVQVHRVDELKP